MMSRTALAWAIAAWAAISWGGRVLIVFDTGSDPWDRIRIAASLLVALVAVLALWSRRRQVPALVAYAVVTVAVWGRSVVTVLTGDHDPGFVAVHLALAIVSLALAAIGVVSVGRTR